MGRPGTNTARFVRAACVAWLAAAALAPAAAAGRMPAVESSVGGTLGISDAPDGGGWSIAVSPMWAVEDGWSFGAMFFADDMGGQSGRLLDPNDGTDLGATELGHTHALGAAWRLDREWGSLLTWMPYASGTWGYYRVVDDQNGRIERQVGSTGFSLGGGVRRAINDRVAVGASIRYHRLFNDRIGRYVGWAVDGSFR